MDPWWEALSEAQRILWGIAVFSSVVFVLQAILMLLGFGIGEGDDGSGEEVADDADSDARRRSLGEYLNFRNVVYFLMGFSWGGLTLIHAGISLSWVIFLSIVAGICVAGFGIFIMAALVRLSDPGNTATLYETIGSQAKVLIGVPGSRNGEGKVNVVVGGRLVDRNAITEEGVDIPRGATVYVHEVGPNNVLVVSTSNPLI